MAGTFIINIIASPRDTVVRMPREIADCRMSRNRRKHGGGDRHAEQADWQVHQPERIVQPRHGARSLTRGEERVDEDVDLRRRQADGARPHEQHDIPQGRVARDRNAASSEIPRGASAGHCTRI